MATVEPGVPVRRGLWFVALSVALVAIGVPAVSAITQWANQRQALREFQAAETGPLGGPRLAPPR
jgi:hypothetical protein